jgi:hypothetical protein
MAQNDSAQVGANLSYTKFLFLILAERDAAALSRVRNAGAMVARGFFNDFDSDGSRDVQPRETIQFLVADREPASEGRIEAAQFAIQVSANYRPRLEELECELTRRLGAVAEVVSIEGADRAPRYTSAELHDYAYKPARTRLSGRVAANAIILPISKTDGWWQKSSLERHGYFYPQRDRFTGGEVKGHARSAEAGIQTIYRRLYHNPDGYQRPDEYDFVTYFECTDEYLPTFDGVHAALRDKQQNPEWQYVREGPQWRGKRVLRW